MSGAGQSWYPLSGWDPVQGDPSAVRAAGAAYEQVATQIQAAATSLRAIADGFQQCSEAIYEVQTRGRRVADQIERVRQRYAATGAALVTYAGGLARAQQIAQDALRQAQNAAAAPDNAQQDLTYWNARDNEVFTGGPANASSPAGRTRRQRGRRARGRERQPRYGNRCCPLFDKLCLHEGQSRARSPAHRRHVKRLATRVAVLALGGGLTGRRGR